MNVNKKIEASMNRADFLEIYRVYLVYYSVNMSACGVQPIRLPWTDNIINVLIIERTLTARTKLVLVGSSNKM